MVRWVTNTLTFYTTQQRRCRIKRWIGGLLLANNVPSVPEIVGIPITREGTGWPNTGFLAWCEHVRWMAPAAFKSWADPHYRLTLLRRVVTAYKDSPYNLYRGRHDL